MTENNFVDVRYKWQTMKTIITSFCEHLPRHHWQMVSIVLQIVLVLVNINWPWVRRPYYIQYPVMNPLATSRVCFSAVSNIATLPLHSQPDIHTHTHTWKHGLPTTTLAGGKMTNNENNSPTGKKPCLFLRRVQYRHIATTLTNALCMWPTGWWSSVRVGLAMNNCNHWIQ